MLVVATLAIVRSRSSLVRRFYHGRLRRAAPWDCGYPWQTARMQDTAEGFGQPIRQIFEPFFRMKRELPTAFDSAPHYRVTVEDPMWAWVYLRIAAATESGSRASWACCSAGASRSTCSTASSPSSTLLFLTQA